MYKIILTTDFYGIDVNGIYILKYDLTKINNNTKHVLLYVVSNIFKIIKNIPPSNLLPDTINALKKQFEHDIFHN